MNEQQDEIAFTFAECPVRVDWDNNVVVYQSEVVKSVNGQEVERQGCQDADFPIDILRAYSLCAAVRLKRVRTLTIDNFLTEKSFAPKPEMTFDFDDIPNSLRRLVLEKRNILISGATGSGKTNLLNVLLKHVPETDRFLTTEDVRELDTSHLLNTVHSFYLIMGTVVRTKLFVQIIP